MGEPAFIGRHLLGLLSVETLTVGSLRDEVASLYPVIIEEISHGLGWGFVGTLPATSAGMCATAGKQWDTAQEHFETALRQAHEMPEKLAQPEVRRWFATMLLERNWDGDRDRARTLLAEAIEMYRTIGMPRHVEMAEELAGS